MNFTQLRKNSIGKLHRLRPLPHRLEGGTHLPPLDDQWRLEAPEDHPKAIRLVNLATGHFIVLERDSLRSWQAPDLLILRCQLTLTDRRRVLVEPLLPPMAPLGLRRSNWKRVLELMPALLDEMRDDLAAYPTRREIVLLKKSWNYWAKGNELSYYFDDHPDLEAHFQMLWNCGLVVDITQNNVTRYLMSEALAAHLGR